jgi:hypothetical protein
MSQTARKVKELEDQKAFVLTWLFQEEEASAVDSIRTQQKIVKKFELRKLNTQYLKMIDDTQKKMRLKQKQQ